MSTLLSAPLPWRPLRRALLRPPTQAVQTPEAVARWGYRRARDLEAARTQHARFAAHLRAEGARVDLHEAPLPGAADACFVCDPALVTPRGVVMLRMGKPERRGEEACLEARLRELELPIAGRIEAPGVVEGGDCLWLDERTLAVGESYRTNPEGIAQLRALLAGVADVLVLQLPHLNGPEECLHLQSLLSFVDERLAVVHLPLSPVPLVKALEARAVTPIDLAPAEFDSLGSNILCTAPGRVVMAAGNPVTAGRIRAAGVHVTELEADDLMWVATGGPTCLTLPLERG